MVSGASALRPSLATTHNERQPRACLEAFLHGIQAVSVPSLLTQACEFSMSFEGGRERARGLNLKASAKTPGRPELGIGVESGSEDILFRPSALGALWFYEEDSGMELKLEATNWQVQEPRGLPGIGVSRLAVVQTSGSVLKTQSWQSSELLSDTKLANQLQPNLCVPTSLSLHPYAPCGEAEDLGAHALQDVCDVQQQQPRGKEGTPRFTEMRG